MIAPTTSDVLTISEAAGVARISRRHLHNLMRAGEGPPVVQLGARRLVRRESLDQWLADRETKGEGAPANDR